MQKLSNQLLPGGYAFVGHSETLHNMDLPSSRSHLLSTGNRKMLELEDELSDVYLLPGRLTSRANQPLFGRFSVRVSELPSGARDSALVHSRTRCCRDARPPT